MHRNSNPIMLLLVVLIIVGLQGCSTVTQIKDDVHWLKLNQMAMDAYIAENYAKAAVLFEKALAKNQDNYTAAYNLACCYALQGDAEKATKFVNVAFDNGYRNIEWIYQDTDFDPIRDEPIFESTLKKLEKKFKNNGEVKYVEAKSMHPYRIRLPNDYDPDKTYPLLVGLHGGAGRAEDFVGQYDKILNPQVIYVTPEGQYPFSANVGPQWYLKTWDLRLENPEVNREADRLVEAYILNTIRAVSADHKVSQVYLLGFSQGATYSYSIGIRNPDEIEGVIAFGGFLADLEKEGALLTNEHIASGKDLRIFMAHGVKDGAVSIEKARDLAKKLEDNGYDVKLQEFEGDHNIPQDVLNMASNWIES